MNDNKSHDCAFSTCTTTSLGWFSSDFLASRGCGDSSSSWACARACAYLYLVSILRTFSLISQWCYLLLHSLNLHFILSFQSFSLFLLVYVRFIFIADSQNYWIYCCDELRQNLPFVLTLRPFVEFLWGFPDIYVNLIGIIVVSIRLYFLDNRPHALF